MMPAAGRRSARMTPIPAATMAPQVIAPVTSRVAAIYRRGQHSLVSGLAPRIRTEVATQTLAFQGGGGLGKGVSAARERLLAWLLFGLRVCPGAWAKATGQARWGTGV
jgi:hypothetical protein